MRVQFGQDLLILVRLGQHGHEVVVLRRGANQRRAADVDVLDAVLRGGALRHRRLERVEVDRHEVDRRNAVLRHLRQMLRQIAAAEDATVDLRHQRLHPAVQDLRKPGVRRHVRDRHAGLAQRAGGAASGQDLDPARGKRLGERHQPRLVRDRNQRAADWHDTGHGGTPWFGSGAG